MDAARPLDLADPYGRIASGLCASVLPVGVYVPRFMITAAWPAVASGFEETYFGGPGPRGICGVAEDPVVG
jgi:hypothetical protein